MGRTKEYVGDTESLTYNRVKRYIAEQPELGITGTRVWCWGIKSMSGDEYYTGTTIENLIECLREYKIKKCYFHNLSWDSEFIVHGLINSGFKPDNNPFGVPKGDKTFTRMKDNRNSVYHMAIKYDGVITELVCSYKLLSSSVADLGRDLGYPKGEIDYDEYGVYEHYNDIPLVAQQYLERDIDIVREALQVFKGTYNIKAMTASGLAYKDFKNNYGWMDYVNDFGGKYYDKFFKVWRIKNMLTPEQWDDVKSSYRGGLTGGDIRYKDMLITGIKGASADANSMYPSCQMYEKMPYGKPLKKAPMLNSWVRLNQIFIVKAKLKEGIYTPIIPSNYKKSKFVDNYLTEVEGEFYWIWDNELAMWEQFYEIEYDIVQQMYWKSKFVFTDWLQIVKLNKENAPSASEELGHKIVQNAGYGRAGMSHKRYHKELVHDPNGIETGTRYGDNGEWVENVVFTVGSELSPVHVASYITACARTMLSKVLYANRGHVLYYDTDSVYCDREQIDGINIHDRHYGAWKYEKKFTMFKYIKSKCYLTQTTHKYKKNRDNPDAGGAWVEVNEISRAIAGLSTDYHENINWDNFYSGAVFEKSKRMRKNINGGSVLTEVRYTL